MNIHKNARTTRYSRAEMVRRVTELHETPRAVATAFGVSCRTVAKWLARHRAEGEAGLADRPSRPHRLREWAYATAYPTSNDRKAALDPWLHNYNWHRPHGSLKSKTPISRLGLHENNLLRLHTGDLPTRWQPLDA